MWVRTPGLQSWSQSATTTLPVALSPCCTAVHCSLGLTTPTSPDESHGGEAPVSQAGRKCSLHVPSPENAWTQHARSVSAQTSLVPQSLKD